MYREHWIQLEVTAISSEMCRQDRCTLKMLVSEFPFPLLLNATREYKGAQTARFWSFHAANTWMGLSLKSVGTVYAYLRVWSM